jgi:putative membrane protein
MTRASSNALLWVLVGISGSAQLATGLFHDIGQAALQAMLLVAPLVLFAFAHGSVIYGVRNMVAFALICVVVTNIVENVNILTGYPGGSYHYSEAMGPKLLLVPLVIGPAYFGVGYLAWMLARLMLGNAYQPESRRATFEVPAIASFGMVAWNLSFDPMASTIRQHWIWKDGGSYFGVPIVNFFSWDLTSFLFFQLYALYLLYRENGRASRKLASRGYWCQVVVLYATIPAMLILIALTTTTTETVVDQAGAAWHIREIYAVCALVSTFTMGAFTVLGLMKIGDLPVDRD